MNEQPDKHIQKVLDSFDKRFSVFDGWQKIIKHITYSSSVKKFITTAILDERERIWQELNKKDNGYHNNYICVEEDIAQEVVKGT